MAGEKISNTQKQSEGQEIMGQSGLTKNEDYVRSLFETLGQGVAFFTTLFDGDTPVDFVHDSVNAACGRLTGLDNVVGRRVSEVISGTFESSPELFELYGRVALTGTPEIFDTYIESLGIWLSVSASSPQPGRLIAVFDNITQRRSAEEALQQAKESIAKAEHQYREIFEKTLEGVFRVSPEGKALAANPALARMLGYGSGEEMTSAITDSGNQVWLDPNDRSHFLQQLEDHEIVRGYECQFKRKDGNAIWVSLNGRKVYGMDGHTFYTEGLVEDITERKRMQDALRKSDENFAKTFRCSPAVIILRDVEDGDRIVDVSDAFEHVTGYRREEIITSVRL